MSAVYFYCLAVLLIVSTAKGQPEQTSDIGENFKQWVHEKLLGAIDDLHKAEEDLKATVRKAVEDAQKELETEYATQLLEYHSHRKNLHPTCFQNGLTQLNDYAVLTKPEIEMLYEENPFSIVAASVTTTTQPSCILMAFEDVGLMLYKVAGYIASILATLDDVINGYGQCAVSTWKKFTCLFTYFGTAVSDVYHTLTGVIQLIDDMIDLGKDIQSQIQRCIHPKTLEIRQQMLLALNNAQTCTQRYNNEPKAK